MPRSWTDSLGSTRYGGVKVEGDVLDRFYWHVTVSHMQNDSWATQAVAHSETATVAAAGRYCTVHVLSILLYIRSTRNKTGIFQVYIQSTEYANSECPLHSVIPTVKLYSVKLRYCRNVSTDIYP